MKYTSDSNIRDEKDKLENSYIKDKKRESKESLSPSRSGHAKTTNKKKIRDYRKKSTVRLKSMNTGIDSSKNLASSNEIFPVTITLSLSNEHFLDSSYYSKELDMKIGILQLKKKYW